MSRHVARFSGWLAVAVGTVAALALGVAAGNLGTPVGVAGALAFGWAAGALEGPSNARRAAGSLAVVFGGLAGLAGPAVAAGGFAGFLVGALGVVAVALLAVDATAGLGEGSLSPVMESLGGSIAAAIAGVAATSVLHVGFGLGVAWLLVVGLAAISLASALGAFVTLQLSALAVGVLVGRARSTVETWFRGDVPIDAWDEMDAFEVAVGDVPRGYWVLLGLQVLLALSPTGRSLVAWLLDAMWLVGDAVAVALQSGVLHGALWLVGLLAAGVLVADSVRRVVVGALSPNPARSLAAGAGGLALLVAVPAAVALAALLWPAGLDGGDLLVSAAPWGASAAVLSLLVMALGVVFAIQVTGIAVAARSLVPDDAAGFALGALCLLLAAVAAAAVGVHELFVFAGVAAALVAWDLGETAVDLGSHLGPDVRTRRAEVVHATGSGAVAVVGVGLAAAALYLLGPLSVPGTDGRAAAALALTLAALVAFSVALGGVDARE